MQQEQTLGSVYPIGYADPDAASRIANLMQDQKTAIVDIRLKPRSRWYAQYNKKAMMERYGHRYMHVEELGNVNYNVEGAPIQLKDPSAVIGKLELALTQGWSLILLCACKKYDGCHRKTVTQLLAELLPELEIVQ